MGMKIKDIVFLTIFLVVAGAGLYVVTTVDVMKKIERTESIMKSILFGIKEGPHEYFPTHAEITEEELKEINVSKIAEEIGKGITVKKKEKLFKIEKKTKEALEITRSVLQMPQGKIQQEVRPQTCQAGQMYRLSRSSPIQCRQSHKGQIGERSLSQVP